VENLQIFNLFKIFNAHKTYKDMLKTVDKRKRIKDIAGKII